MCRKCNIEKRVEEMKKDPNFSSTEECRVEPADAETALRYLQALIGQPFQHGHKFDDCELFMLRFGEIEDPSRMGFHWNIHVLSDIKIISHKEKLIYHYDSWTSYDYFRENIKPLIGLCVKNVRIMKNNRLRLNLGDYFIDVMPGEEGDECWRFFDRYDAKNPHLVVSNNEIELVY
ncbi:MAG: hypothetical protein E7486_05205 [Ruminococcaceae bacterium]|nr:hypothetical protein [Oscillospiraceae bacterium]